MLLYPGMTTLDFVGPQYGIAGLRVRQSIASRRVGMLRDTVDAQSMLLLAEDAPQPPCNAATPRTAPLAVTAMLKGLFKDFDSQARAALAAAKDSKSSSDRWSGRGLRVWKRTNPDTDGLG